MMKKLLLLLSIVSTSIFAQCPPGQKQVVVTIIPDNYPAEISWNLKDNAGTILLAGTSNSASVCVDSTKCLTFSIFDTFGDGICCSYGTGSYHVTYGGSTVASGGNYGNSEITSFNCPPGSNCNQAIVADTGMYTALGRNYWYLFTPTVNGMYEISTCYAANTCDTKLWVYANCTGNINNTNTGTLYYDDNNGGCGIKAVISGALTAGTPYYIRVGDEASSCTGPIAFSIDFTGGIVGCMDPMACNYNPMASDSGTCYYSGNPLCVGPDLTISQPEVQATLHMGNTTATNCEVVEGCLAGYGNRQILQFSTRISNVGQLDYYVGNPGNNPDQFSFINCHGHPHYEGYADYILYDSNGNPLPIGRKNGFCVMDLDCPAGIPAQYGCGNMGITAGCADIYGAGLSCQWIDITNVDTGNYTLAVKVNWDQSPDALGHYETNYVNNWAQVCIHITENAGMKNFTINPNCPAYVDCAGTPFGNSIVDCNGTCGGGAKKGDLNGNSLQQTSDAQIYVSQILSSSITPTTCNDLNASNSISVWDAALVNQCAVHGSSSNTLCNFPRGAVNPSEVVILSVDTVNTLSQYVDISITNPNNQVLAYEFTLHGVQILNVQNMIPASDYPITPEFIVGGNKVIGISYLDSAINKKYVPTKLCRVFYSALTDNNICISDIVEVVNKDYEAVNAIIGDTCIAVQTIGLRSYGSTTADFVIMPNPANDNIMLKPYFVDAEYINMSIVDIMGREVIASKLKAEFTEQFVDINSLQVGVYTITLKSDKGTVSKKLVVKR
ncbi:MAG: uncharacterized protein K0S33_3647 [Bacteroidetes bacterium]|jgi:hypothetical protein|nr:uncharacterized protein [Bacteroidota bacterium]